MNSLIRSAIAGAASGFLSAFIVDINAWSRAPEGSAFNWKLAAKRWVAGAIAGVTAAVGVGAMTPPAA